MDCLNIGLIGCGSRGLSILERIFSISEFQSGKPMNIDVFESNLLGCGVHSPDQPDYLLLNTITGQLGVFPDMASLSDFPDARERAGPSFLTWCRNKNIKIDPINKFPADDGRDVEAGDFLPRRLLGAYLIDSFLEISSKLPSHINLIVHRENVKTTAVNSLNQVVLETDSGISVTVDRLILAIGHTGCVRSTKTGKIEEIYPLPMSLTNIKPKQPVVIYGLGLAAMDVLSSLTLGRGGRYEYLDNGKHIYHPSGKEPNMFIQSRKGLPFRARPDGLERYIRHQPVILTNRRIHLLRVKELNNKFDFDRVILPIIKMEMRCAAIAFFLSNKNIIHQQHILNQLRLTFSNDSSGLVNGEILLQSYEKSMVNPINIDSVISSSLPKCVNSDNYNSWLYNVIETDFLEASSGLLQSPLKIAIEVWRDLRESIRMVVDFDGLTEQSHQRFYQVWNKLINRLVAGPQKERHADMLALCDAGLLTFLYPKTMPNPKGCQYISAYINNSCVLNSDNSVVRDLNRLGLIRPKIGANGIDLDNQFHPRSWRGESVNNIWVLGPLAEGSSYYNHYVGSPGTPSRLFMDAHRVAKSILTT